MECGEVGLAIEVFNDLGSHLIADGKLGMIESHGDIPDILASKGIVNPDLALIWKRMIGFRNILVHDYLDIDRKLVFEVLQEHLKDFRDLKAIFAQFL